MLCGLSAAQAQFDEGVVAYLTGDYDKAFNTMQSLSEVSNHGLAQYYLGMMYLRGQGAEQDDKSAGQWFRRAAKNHIPQAQYKLGQLYMQGRGVPQDYEFAYAWFRTSASLQHEKANSAVDKAKAKLSTRELGEAEQLSQEFISKYGPQEDVDLSQPIQIEN